jgi:peroxiredoxin (alkyl hydroperoxide reductase subunit C)
MVSDSGGAIGRAYGVYEEEHNVDARARFLIDPDGTVQSIEVIADIAGRNIAEILRQLRSLHHHRATGDVMPCGWHPVNPQSLHRITIRKSL